MVALQNPDVRVLVAGRSPAWCAGVARFLEVPPLAPVAAFTVDAALSRAAEAPPALAVIDRRPADAPGAEPAAGACGRLPPTWTREAVVDAVHDAPRGLTRLDPEALSPPADLARRGPARRAVSPRRSAWCCA